jgi:hypothetical protein
MIFKTGDNGVSAMTILGDGKVGIGTTAPGYNLVVNSTGNSVLQIKAGDTSWSSIYFGEQSTAYRGVVQYNHTDDYMDFYTASAERMRIDSLGRLLVGQSSESVIAGGSKLHTPSLTVEVSSDVTGSYWNRNDTAATWVVARFYTDETQVGYIQAGTSATTYSTSSDYRLKENVDYEWDATTRLKQLKPARFNWIADDTNTLLEGFLAHEVSDIVPEAIVGEKDAMIDAILYVEGDDLPEGKSVGDVKVTSHIDPQGIDQSKLVPLLVKAIQELEARIATLEG